MIEASHLIVIPLYDKNASLVLLIPLYDKNSLIETYLLRGKVRKTKSNFLIGIPTRSRSLTLKKKIRMNLRKLTRKP